MEKKIRVTQIRSRHGRIERVQQTLRALGLGKIGKSREHFVTPAISGMIRQVLHLVKVEIV